MQVTLRLRDPDDLRPSKETYAVTLVQRLPEVVRVKLPPATANALSEYVDEDTADILTCDWRWIDELLLVAMFQANSLDEFRCENHVPEWLVNVLQSRRDST